MAGVLRRDGRELLDGGAVALHVGPCHRGVDVHEHRALLTRTRCSGLGTARLGAVLQRLHDLGQVLDIDSAGEGGEGLALVDVVELLHSESEDHVVDAGGDHGGRLVQGRR